MEAVTSGQLRVWAGKVKWIRWERKKLGIKDFGPGHSSCPLTDFRLNSFKVWLVLLAP